MKDQLLTGMAALIAQVPKKSFGEAVLQYLSTAAQINNFGAFYIPDLARPKPVLSIWSGRISDYWYRHNAKAILADQRIYRQIVARIQAAPQGGISIDRWHPDDGDPRKQMYQRANLIERIGVYSQDGRSGFQSFFLRSTNAGWLTDAEFEALCDRLPTVHELVGLRHRIVGSENFQFTPGTVPSSLLERNVSGFADLSAREAQVCDSLVLGKTAAGTGIELGISEATVRTLRQRAYRKLGVGSAAELMALIVNDARLS